MSRRSSLVLGGPPRHVGDLLSEGADNAAAAGTVLCGLLERHDESLVAELERLESEGDRITHDLLKAVRHVRVAGADRGALMRLAEALDDTVDAIEHAGRVAVDCDCGTSGRLLGCVVRDIARTEAQMIETLRGAASADHESTVEAAHKLSEEGRGILRQAIGQTLCEGIDPMAAMRQKMCLEALATALKAGVRAVHTTDLAVIDL